MSLYVQGNLKGKHYCLFLAEIIFWQDVEIALIHLEHLKEWFCFIQPLYESSLEICNH